MSLNKEQLNILSLLPPNTREGREFFDLTKFIQNMSNEQIVEMESVILDELQSLSEWKRDFIIYDFLGAVKSQGFLQVIKRDIDSKVGMMKVVYAVHLYGFESSEENAEEIIRAVSLLNAESELRVSLVNIIGFKNSRLIQNIKQLKNIKDRGMAEYIKYLQNAMKGFDSHSICFH